MKNVKKCKGVNKSYTPFLCVFLICLAIALCEGGCASAISQIPQDKRMDSGLNITASFMDSTSPYEIDKSVVDVVKVKVINDGNSEIKTEVVCERNGHKKRSTVVMKPYTVRELYFGFNRDDYHREFTCRLEDVEFLEWFPLE